MYGYGMLCLINSGNLGRIEFRISEVVAKAGLVSGQLSSPNFQLLSIIALVEPVSMSLSSLFLGNANEGKDKDLDNVFKSSVRIYLPGLSQQYP